VIYFQCPKHIF